MRDPCIVPLHLPVPLVVIPPRSGGILLLYPECCALISIMASATTIPIAEYLQTNYRPDREYVDGELRERNVGKWEHARVQWLLANWF